jgi:alpha-ketoglutarate-dependent taurine dioxygenase
MMQKPISVDAINLTALALQVSKRGWLHIRGTVPIADIRKRVLKIVSALGSPVHGRGNQAIEILTPLPEEHAKTKGLSSQYGLGRFPLHVDGSHQLQPPHFIVLACQHVGSRPAPTILIRFDELPLHAFQRKQCESEVFLIRNGRHSFYSTITDRSRPFVRFDPGCMTPCSDQGRAVMDAVNVRPADLTEIEWESSDILIIDNWNVLHGRGRPNSVASSDRCLLRVSVQ